MFQAIFTRLKALWLVQSSFVLLLTSPAVAASVEIEAEGPVIELRINESIQEEPDLVSLSAGVSTKAPKAVEAMRLNAAEMTRVIDTIKAQGIDAEDIQTSGISLNPIYDYNSQLKENEFKGYSVTNRVSVILRQIEETGAVLDALVVAGATNLSGPNFMLSNEQEARDIARNRALERAEERVADYARRLGFSGYRVLEISENVRGSGRAPQQAMLSRMAASAPEAMAPVQPGLVSTSVSLVVKYELIDDEAEEDAATVED